MNQNSNADSSAKNELLKWVQSKIPEYGITNFTKDWNDGRAICALVEALEPGLCPNHRSLDPSNNLDNATRGMSLGMDHLSVPMVLMPDEMINPKVDEMSMMTYISYFRDLPPRQIDWASKCRAHGPGLIEAYQNQPAPFVVECPSKCPPTMEVKVFGPKSEAQVKVLKNGDNYAVEYMPTEPGEYQIHVLIDGKHVPGSIFHVLVLEEESLGGEGKIRVFYSTTSAKNDKTRPLQELLMGKGVHLRPEFEPWIAVDIMEPKDRDAVFRKAGTKDLPIVYIDDVYVGTMQTMFALEAEGKLDKLLNFKNEDKEAVSKFMKNWVPPEVNQVQIPKATDPAKVTPKAQAAATPTAAAPKVDVASGKFKEEGVCANCGTKPANDSIKFCQNCGDVLKFRKVGKVGE